MLAEAPWTASNDITFLMKSYVQYPRSIFFFHNLSVTGIDVEYDRIRNFLSQNTKEYPNLMDAELITSSRLWEEWPFRTSSSYN